MLWLQLEPSLVRKMGSRPRVATKRCWTLAAETDIPSLGWWQVAQERPLLPKLWKKGPARSMPPPLVLYVSEAPLGFANNMSLGMKKIRRVCWPLITAMTINMVQKRRKEP